MYFMFVENNIYRAKMREQGTVSLWQSRFTFDLVLGMYHKYALMFDTAPPCNLFLCRILFYLCLLTVCTLLERPAMCYPSKPRRHWTVGLQHSLDPTVDFWNTWDCVCHFCVPMKCVIYYSHFCNHLSIWLRNWVLQLAVNVPILSTYKLHSIMHVPSHVWSTVHINRGREAWFSAGCLPGPVQRLGDSILWVQAHPKPCSTWH